MTDYLKFIDSLLISALFIPILYAETHYRFKYFFSYLKKKEPEIIADIPSRVTSGMDIPVLIIIKDADKFPVLLHHISIKENNKVIFQKKVNLHCKSPYADFFYHIPSSELNNGIHHISVQIDYETNGRIKKCLNDNHRGTSHDPLPLVISEDSLPRFANCFLGETHSHTNYTSDQVEFGASLSATRIMAKAIGLDFFCATDHSYDLDDYLENYLTNDPDLEKWKAFQQEVDSMNQEDEKFLIIPGEEVTVRNNRDNNVHLLIYNSKTFYPGSGDSGEKWFRNRSELSISQLTSQIPETALAVSAHPSETPPILQKLLINRGSWQTKDCSESGLHVLQFINGGAKHFLEKGKKLWVEQLLSDNRLTGIAGNDAHGNFSRFRQIGFPFFTMRENYYHLFGKWVTGIYIKNNNFDMKSVLDALKSGNCYMTNGPALLLNLSDENRKYEMGEECINPKHCYLRVRSSKEFGTINSMILYNGDLEKKSESVFHHITRDTGKIDFDAEIQLNELPHRGYIRVEIETEQKYQALSNPIWYKKNS
jgi:hypothetical protein